MLIKLLEKTQFTEFRVLELYSYACSSGEQNAAILYIIVHHIYIRGLIHGIGRGVPNAVKTLKLIRSSEKNESMQCVRRLQVA